MKNSIRDIMIRAYKKQQDFAEKAKAMRDAMEFKNKEEPAVWNKNQHVDELGKAVMDGIAMGIDADGRDLRYIEPKGKHKAPDELISETIESTEIYSRAKELILNAQRKQVGYGLDKYPEPLNADTWSTVETIDHIIDESIDKLHYLVMLRLKLEQDLNQPCEEPPTHALYADGKKYLSYIGPDYDIMGVDLANEDLDAMRYLLPADKFVKMAKQTMFNREADKAASDFMNSHKSLYATDVLLNKSFDIDFNGKPLYVDCQDVKLLDGVGVMYLLEDGYGDKFWVSKEELQKSIVEKG